MTWDGDPVRELDLVGVVVGSVGCSYMVSVAGLRNRRGSVACGQYAFLKRYPDPYGLRSECEDGHSVPLHPRQVPTVRSLKSETD